MRNFEFLDGAVDAKIALGAVKDELSEFDRMTRTQSSLSPELEKQRATIHRRFELLIRQYMDIEQRALTELEKIRNGNLVCILQWKYLCGYSWKQISEKFPDKPSTDALKKRFQRYIKEYEDERN